MASQASRLDAGRQQAGTEQVIVRQEEDNKPAADMYEEATQVGRRQQAGSRQAGGKLRVGRQQSGTRTRASWKQKGNRQA